MTSIIMTCFCAPGIGTRWKERASSSAWVPNCPRKNSGIRISDPSDPRNNVVKVKPYDFGLRPAWAVEVGRHWRFGVEGHIGLRNVLTQRSDLNLTGSLHLHDITGTVCFYF